jgi:two-component system CheB/CheR fusion protein
MVLFSRHDLISNPPFLKLDLLSCRNLLIYFGANLQKHIIPVFHYALNPNGYLFLGKSETVGQYSDLFATLDGKSKIYQRKIGNALHTIKLSTFKTNKLINQAQANKKAATQKQEYSVPELIKETLYINYDHPYVVVNDLFDIIEIYGNVQNYLSLPTGSMNVNVLKMVRQDLLIELRSILAKSLKENTECKTSIKKIKTNNTLSYIRIHVKPLIANVAHNKLSLVVFEEMEIDDLTVYTEKKAITNETDFVRIRELEHELAATKEHLQTYIEELETTNEELQSLNEEMQSTNEELQSSNEELETTNEELQSTNEEIQIAYSELKHNNEELNKKEQQLIAAQKSAQALLNNTLQGFILVDNSYKTIAFNEQASLFCKQVNNSHLKKNDAIIDHLPSNQLSAFIEDFKQCLAGETVNKEYIFEQAQVNKKTHFTFNFTPVPDSTGKTSVMSIGLLDITSQMHVLGRLKSTEQTLNSIFMESGTGISVTDKDGRYVRVNPRYCKIFGYTEQELLSKDFSIIIPEEEKKAGLQYRQQIITGKKVAGKEWSAVTKTGKIIDIYINSTTFKDEHDQLFVVTSVTDITERKKTEKLFQQAAQIAKIGSWELDLSNNNLFWSDIVKEIHEVDTNFVPELENAISFYKDGLSRIMIRQALEKAIQQQEDFDLELQIVTRKGKEVWVRAIGKAVIANGNTVKIVGVFQNIQSVKSIQADLRIFSQMVEQSPSSIVVTDTNGNIEYVNPAFCEISGYSNVEVVGKNPRILKSGKTPDNTYAEMWHDLKSGKTWNGILCNKKRNGELYWESASIAPIINNEGKTISYVAIKENITEKVLLEKQLKEEQSEFHKKMTDAIIAAQEKERTEIGRELHDNINQLLASAKMFLKFSRSDEESFVQTERILQQSIDEIRKLSHLLVLPSVINSKLSETIDTIVYELKGNAEVNIHKEIINFDDYDVSHNLKMNIYRILQIQLNNIYKHAKARNIWINIVHHETKKYIEMSIKDDGIGFNTAKRTSGIGLLNIRTRTSLFDGKVDIISSEGNGCEVKIVLNT